MSANNPATASDTNVTYKLPSEIESRFDTELGVVYEDCDNPSYGQEQSFDLLELTPDQVKKHFATEQVTLLESIVSEIEKMKSGKQRFGENGKRIKDIVDKGGSIIDAVLFQQIYDNALDDVIAKVQAKLQEYKS